MRVYKYDVNGTATTPAIEFDAVKIQGQPFTWSVYFVSTSGTHSIQPQVSPDGVNWFAIGSAITANNTQVRSEKALYFRFVIGGTASVGTLYVVW